MVNSDHTLASENFSEDAVGCLSNTDPNETGSASFWHSEAQTNALLSISAALRDVADAIRNGRGNGYTTPESLTAIAEQLGSISGALYSDPRRSQ